MKRAFSLARNERGATALEFALVAPVLFLFIFGIAQLGTLYMADSSLRHAVAEGARYAAIYPRPSDEAIIARINAKRVGLRPSRITGPTLRHVEPAGAAAYTEIDMGYSVPLNFIFFEAAPVQLQERRLVYTYPPTASSGGS